MIETVVNEGTSLRIRNEKGQTTGIITLQKGWYLVGYTSSSVTVFCGTSTWVYDEKGNRKRRA